MEDPLPVECLRLLFQYIRSYHALKIKETINNGLPIGISDGHNVFVF
jgi:hypothetical protein